MDEHREIIDVDEFPEDLGPAEPPRRSLIGRVVREPVDPASNSDRESLRYLIDRNNGPILKAIEQRRLRAAESLDSLYSQDPGLQTSQD